MPLTASADLITFTHTGAFGSGSIGGNPFSNQAFTITATGDTLDRQSFVSGFFIDHVTASITIDNVGTFTFVTPTRTFVNNTSDLVGFSRAGIMGSDLYDGPVDSAFGSWDMLSSIGPISGGTGLSQWGDRFGPVITSGGQLIFNDSGTTGSFQGQVIPEPSAMTLFGIGTLGLVGHCGWRRRRRVLNGQQTGRVR
jgi:hypothetical protein